LTVDGLLGRRYMARFVDSIVLIFIVGAAGAILPASSPVYQAIHDRLTRTWFAAPESTIQLRLS
jgi:hypothetical protein